MMVMLAWGFNVAAIKTLVSNIDPLLLTSARVFAAGIMVLLLCCFLHIFRLPTKREAGIILFISIFNVIAQHSLLAIGLLYTSGINAGLIGGINPLSTLLFSILFINREITRQRIFGFILGFIGVAITTLSGSGEASGLSLGDFLVFMSILSTSVSFILISKLKPDLDVRLLTGYLLVTGSIAVFFIGMGRGVNPSELTQLFNWKLGMVFLFSAGICTALGQMAYNYAIKKIGPAETTIFLNFSTFFAVVGSVIFLEETMTLSHFLGLIFIVSGVLIGTGGIEKIIRKKY